jgi:hypothetical protein
VVDRNANRSRGGPIVCEVPLPGSPAPERSPGQYRERRRKWSTRRPQMGAIDPTFGAPDHREQFVLVNADPVLDPAPPENRVASTHRDPAPPGIGPIIQRMCKAYGVTLSEFALLTEFEANTIRGYCHPGADGRYGHPSLDFLIVLAKLTGQPVLEMGWEDLRLKEWERLQDEGFRQYLQRIPVLPKLRNVKNEV